MIIFLVIIQYLFLISDSITKNKILTINKNIHNIVYVYYITQQEKWKLFHDIGIGKVKIIVYFDAHSPPNDILYEYNIHIYVLLFYIQYIDLYSF